MKRWGLLFAVMMLVTAAAVQSSGTLSLDDSGSEDAIEANERLIDLAPSQLLAVSYINSGSVPCEQGQGADSPYECGNTLSFTVPGFPAGDIDSIVCAPATGYTFASIDDCDAVGGGNPGSGTSGNANINVQVNEQPCDNPTTVFATITLTKTVAAGGDQLVLSLTPSNCGTT